MGHKSAHALAESGGGDVSSGDAHGQMLLALAAYAAYVVNAAQFVMKLRAARRQETGMAGLNAA